MSTLKTIIKNNPIDAYSAWNRRRLAKKGMVEKRDNQIYRHVGLRFFPKILHLTNQLTIEGTENILKLPKKGFVVVSNHQYALDPFFVGCRFTHKSAARKIHWVSKVDNFNYPIQKSIIQPFGTIPLAPDRTMTDETRRQIEERLKKGIGVGMFPEGTRSENGILGKFHAGAARICLEHNVPYIPVAIRGKRSFFKGKCHIVIGKPVILAPNLECNYINAKQIAVDQQAQVQALFDGRLDEVPKCRFEYTGRFNPKFETNIVKTTKPKRRKMELEKVSEVSSMEIY